MMLALCFILAFSIVVNGVLGISCYLIFSDMTHYEGVSKDSWKRFCDERDAREKAERLIAAIKETVAAI